MVRYHMFFYDIDDSAKRIIFYSTDTSLLTFVADNVISRFGASEVRNEDMAQSGDMAVYFRGPFDSRYVEHYINQLLCGNGWEPYDDCCFKLRYEA